MIKVHVPNNNINERKYILDIMVKDFLGLDYELALGSEHWEIEIENGIKIIFEDHFFNKYPEDLEYLDLSNIPTAVKYIKNEFTSEDDIPVIYGTDKLDISDEYIVCGIDIFASSFFMLTRWEEYVNKTRDKHDRFPAYSSLAFKNNFLNRPVVNEYVEILWHMLLSVGYNGSRKQHVYKQFLTHDVDIPLKYPSILSGFREILGDIIKRKDLKRVFQNVNLKLKTHFKLSKDPYDTFDYLMNMSDKIGIKSYFFFMGRGITPFDNFYKSKSKHTKDLVYKISEKGHFIGMHPTYGAYNNSQQFAKEKKELEKVFNLKITTGRQHFLRFEVPTTWQLWEDNGMTWDSSMSYADKEGFRCGICYDFNVFNVLTREKLKLLEKPLIVMEGSFSAYQKDITPKDMVSEILLLKNTVKKYDGNFVFLWHNSSFNTIDWKKYEDAYEEIVK